MKTLKEQPLRLKTLWPELNQDAYFCKTAEFLGRSWGDIAEKVNQGFGVVLASKKMHVGTAIPFPMMQQFERAVSADVFAEHALVSVQRDQLKPDFRLGDDSTGEFVNFLVEDSKSGESIVVVNELFSAVFLRVGEDHKVSFKGALGEVVYGEDLSLDQEGLDARVSQVLRELSL